MKRTLQSNSVHSEMSLNDIVIEGVLGEGGSGKVYKVGKWIEE